MRAAALAVMLLAAALCSACAPAPARRGERDARAAALRQAELWVAAGIAAKQNGDPAGAERCYRRALRLFPGHAAASNNLAMSYLSQDRRVEEAVRLAEDALRDAGALEPYLLDTLARAYMRQRRYADAVAALDRAESAVSLRDSKLRDELMKTRRELSSGVAARAR